MFIALYLQGKFGPSKSSVVMALKSWWRPSFTFSVTGMHATCARLCTLEKDPYTPRSMNQFRKWFSLVSSIRFTWFSSNSIFLPFTVYYFAWELEVPLICSYSSIQNFNQSTKLHIFCSSCYLIGSCLRFFFLFWNCSLYKWTKKKHIEHKVILTVGWLQTWIVHLTGLSFFGHIDIVLFCPQLWMIILREQHHLDLAFEQRISDDSGSVFIFWSWNVGLCLFYWQCCW